MTKENKLEENVKKEFYYRTYKCQLLRPTAKALEVGACNCPVV